MQEFRDYIFSLAVAALICGAIHLMAGDKSGVGKMLRLLSGIFMLTVVMKPAINIKLDDLAYYERYISLECEEAVTAGEQIAGEELKERIISQTQAYILQQATSLGCEIHASVQLEDYVPASATIQGNISPYAKKILSGWIANNLGIPAEAQTWIG